ncbi:death domain-containing protein CRADD [Denticeps clupeoides]|uniref:Uncharacterized protein n=1 Tax=Denticeps clupeoides TaxID=299321 RepID=A0AAY4AU28_9TELE|nr:death domain-containing protein CRADD [Denticeps clupeoides]
MNASHKEILLKLRLKLSENISVDDTVLQYLYQEGVLTQSHVEEIQTLASNKKRTLKLLDVLPTRGSTAFELFLQSLEFEYPWVKEELEQELDASGQRDTGGAIETWSVPDSILQTVPSDQHLNQLASRLGSEWQTILLDLGLSPGAVYRCSANHPFSVQSQILAGLILWKQSSGRVATFYRLLQSLQAAALHPSILNGLFP